MSLVVSFYKFFQPRRGWLLLALLALLLFSAWSLNQLRVEESIEAMLPDRGSQVARDFRLLQEAPFARKLVILLTVEAGGDSAQLAEAGRLLENALPPELFSNLLSGPDRLADGKLFGQLGDYLPLLADREDLQALAERLTPEQIERQLADAYAQLVQPQGFAVKERLRRDPLQLDGLALSKLQSLNPLGEVRLQQGRFLSADGSSSLILADTPVPITDAAGAKELLAAFRTACRDLPAGIRAELISGHPYTLANAATIQADMQRLLLASGLGILLLFLIFLRSLRALFVYLLPLLSMLVAVLVAAGWFGTLSGITIGFGAVLLGITIDFGLHVYFSLRYGSGAKVEQLLRAVSRPVLFGGLTTLVAFAVLLRSALPGQRQLALFAMAGIIAALVLALLVLPHFIGKQRGALFLSRHQLRRHIYDRAPGLRKLVLAAWLVALGLAGWQAFGVQINGELRKLSYQPAALQQAEQRLAEQWGNLRGRALIFAEGENLEAALQNNEQVWQRLQQHQLERESVSLAPLLPSQQRQQQQLQRWEQFWQQHRANSFDLLQGSAQQYGFAPTAFEPFWQRLDQVPTPLGPEQLRSWGLGSLLDNLLLGSEGSYRVISLIPDRPELIVALEPELAELPGVTLVSQSRFGRQLSSEIGSDFSSFIVSAALAVLVLLILLFRRLSNVLLALLPVMTGLLVMFGGMGWLGMPLNLFNVVASILIIGLGVDYGIFMVCHAQQEENLASARAVLISGLTTLVGFGALVLAEHPALHSIGLTVLLGISAAVPTAILVIPAFRPKRY